MAKQPKEVTINGIKFKLQPVKPTWYWELTERCKLTGENSKTTKFMDELFKNVVVEPVGVRNDGLAYFDAEDDIQTPGELLSEIISFLMERNRQRGSSTQS